MTGALATVIRGFAWFALAYFLVLNTWYLGLVIVAALETIGTARRAPFAGHDEIFQSALAPPITVVVPARNEAATIVACVRGLLHLRYPVHEVVVIEDGSTDDTFERLREAFDLVDIPRVIRNDVPIIGRINSTHAPESGEPRRRAQGQHRSPSRRCECRDQRGAVPVDLPGRCRLISGPGRAARRDQAVHRGSAARRRGRRDDPGRERIDGRRRADRRCPHAFGMARPYPDRRISAGVSPRFASGGRGCEGCCSCRAHSASSAGTYWSRSEDATSSRRATTSSSSRDCTTSSGEPGVVTDSRSWRNRAAGPTCRQHARCSRGNGVDGHRRWPRRSGSTGR